MISDRFLVFSVFVYDFKYISDVPSQWRTVLRTPSPSARGSAPSTVELHSFDHRIAHGLFFVVKLVWGMVFIFSNR